MRYAVSKINSRQRDTAYRVYVTDALKFIAENTARYAGGGYMKARYEDLIHPKPEDTRTAEEIIEHMKKKLAQV